LNIYLLHSLQSLDAVSEDLAIEDSILVLDRALQTDKSGMTVDIYLKQVSARLKEGCKGKTLALK
jgi:hypothetical protein